MEIRITRSSNISLTNRNGHYFDVENSRNGVLHGIALTEFEKGHVETPLGVYSFEVVEGRTMLCESVLNFSSWGKMKEYDESSKPLVNHYTS